MVVTLGPGKFYGSSLPRPRFYTDVKFNDHRVDPPPSVTDPLMTWAHDAHWSMGGLSSKRHRLQGRIEGNVEKLRAQRENEFDHRRSPNRSDVDKEKKRGRSSSGRISETPSPPPAPVAIKRRRVLSLVDEVDDDEEEFCVRKGPVRKLGDDFERVARECGMVADKAGGDGGGESVAGRTRSRRNQAADVKIKKKLVKGGSKFGGVGSRSSPRLVKS